jgi:hypothetical protein
MVDFVFLWQMSEIMFDRSLEYSMLLLGGLYADITMSDLLESRFKPSICNSEILPDESDYEIFRKDRKDGFGGVMLAIKSNINSNPIDITTVTDCDCEIIARKIECDSNKSYKDYFMVTDAWYCFASIN